MGYHYLGDYVSLKIVYEYLTRNLSFTGDRLAYAFFFLLFCFGWGCLLGLLRSEKENQNN